MTQGTVEERLVRLERLVDNVLARLSCEREPQKDWRRTVGMFDDDPIMKGVIEEALRRREEERRQFYEEYDKQEREP